MAAVMPAHQNSIDRCDSMSKANETKQHGAGDDHGVSIKEQERRQGSNDSPKSTTQTTTTALLSSSVRGATFLVLLQIGARGLTFAVNQFLLRFMSPESLAVSTQLDIYLTSVLYFARESFRVALQRQTDAKVRLDKDRWRQQQDQQQDQQHDRDGAAAAAGLTTDAPLVPKADAPSGIQDAHGAIDDDSSAGRTQVVVNISHVSILLSVPLAAGLATAYLRSASATALSTPLLRESLVVYGVAAVVELLAEPCFVVVQQKMLYRVRAGAESLATLARCLVTCCAVVHATRKSVALGVLPFAMGQLAYAFTLVAVYLLGTSRIASRGGFSLYARKLSGRTTNADRQYLLGYLSRDLLSLGGTLFLQSGIKHVLTQGDALLMATLASLRDQGVYALAANYGGLLARVFFQPIEESSRNLFAKLLCRDGSTGKPSRDGVRSARKVLRDMLRLYVLLALVASAFGPSVAPVLLSIVAGRQWTASGAGQVLATYCYYIPLLAVNGVTEAFVSAVATPAQLNGQSAWMFGFSVGFAGAGYVFIRALEWGAQGLVWANAVNMALRILWSARFIHTYLQEMDDVNAGLDLSSMLPRHATLAVGTVVAASVSRWNVSRLDSFESSAAFALLAVATVLLVAYLERVFLWSYCRALIPSRWLSTLTSRTKTRTDERREQY